MKNRLIVNPTTDDFRDAVAAEVFVDKSELIHYTNSVMNTPPFWKNVCSADAEVVLHPGT